MEITCSKFIDRLKRDRDFRRKVLIAWRSGELGEALLDEGYKFSPEELDRSVPQVRTGVRAGSCSEKFSCSCGP